MLHRSEMCTICHGGIHAADWFQTVDNSLFSHSPLIREYYDVLSGGCKVFTHAYGVWQIVVNHIYKIKKTIRHSKNFEKKPYLYLCKKNLEVNVNYSFEFLPAIYPNQEPGSSGSIVSGYGLDDRAIGVRYWTIVISKPRTLTKAPCFSCSQHLTTTVRQVFVNSVATSSRTRWTPRIASTPCFSQGNVHFYLLPRQSSLIN
jgi:hypothetical protein